MWQSLLDIENEQLFNYIKKYKIKTASSFAIVNSFFESSTALEIECELNNIQESIAFFNLKIKINIVNIITTNNIIDYTIIIQKLIDNLNLKVNRVGLIVRILNTKEILVKWQKYKYEIRRKYKRQSNIDEIIKQVDIVIHNETKMHQLIYSSYYSIFLKPYYFKNNIFPVKSSFELYRFLGRHNLPVNLVNTSEKEGDKKIVKSVATINKGNFNQREYNQWLKKNVDIYDLKVILDFEFESKFVYTKENILTNAEQLIETGVYGCFSNTLATVITEIK